MDNGLLPGVSVIFIYVFFFLVCSAGSYINGDSCDKCPVNTYSTSINSDRCENCPTGTNTEGQIGLTSPFACGMLDFNT